MKECENPDKISLNTALYDMHIGDNGIFHSRFAWWELAPRHARVAGAARTTPKYARICFIL